MLIHAGLVNLVLSRWIRRAERWAMGMAAIVTGLLQAFFIVLYPATDQAVLILMNGAYLILLLWQLRRSPTVTPAPGPTSKRFGPARKRSMRPGWPCLLVVVHPNRGAAQSSVRALRRYSETFISSIGVECFPTRMSGWHRCARRSIVDGAPRQNCWRQDRPPSLTRRSRCRSRVASH